MTDQFVIRAEWGARRESARECANRTGQLLHYLGSCHLLVARWNAKAKTFAEAKKRELTPAWQSLEPFFEPFEPIEGEIAEDQGFCFFCWNGQHTSDLRATMGIFCGRADTSLNSVNHLWIELPWKSPKVETLYQPEVLERIMRAVLNAWEPDSIALTSREYSHRYIFPEVEQLPWPRTRSGPDVGWFTYLSAGRLGKLSGTPPCDEIITLRDRGSFFIISREHLFRIDSADDVARLRALIAYLEANHALEPLPEEKPVRKKVQRKTKSKLETKAKTAAKPRAGKRAAPAKAAKASARPRASGRSKQS